MLLLDIRHQREIATRILSHPSAYLRVCFLGSHRILILANKVLEAKLASKCHPFWPILGSRWKGQPLFLAVQWELPTKPQKAKRKVQGFPTTTMWYAKKQFNPDLFDTGTQKISAEVLSFGDPGSMEADGHTPRHQKLHQGSLLEALGLNESTSRLEAAESPSAAYWATKSPVVESIPFKINRGKTKHLNQLEVECPKGAWKV